MFGAKVLIEPCSTGGKQTVNHNSMWGFKTVATKTKTKTKTKNKL